MHKNRLRWATVLAVATLLAASGILGIVNAQSEDGVPETFSLPRPHVGDRAVYQAQLSGAWNTVGWESSGSGQSVPVKGEAMQMFAMQWMEPEMVRDGNGLLRHANVQQIEGVAFVPFADSGDAAWLPYNSLRWFDPDSMQYFASGSNDTLRFHWQEVSPLAGRSDTTTDGFFRSYHDPIQDCIFTNPFQGNEVELASLQSIPTACEIPGLIAGASEGASLRVVGIDDLPGDREALHIELTDPVNPIGLWYMPQVPYPVRIAFQNGIDFSGGGSRLATLDLVEFERGDEPLRDWDDLGDRDIAPVVRFQAPEPWGPDDSGVDHPFPLSEAFTLAREDLTWNNLRDYLDSHPDAFTSNAWYDIWENDGRVERVWEVTLTDGDDAFAFRATATTMEGIGPGGILPGADVPVYRFEEEDPQDWVSELRAAPEAAPRVADAMQRWRTYAPEEFGAANEWEYQVMCNDEACSQTRATLWAGYAHNVAETTLADESGAIGSESDWQTSRILVEEPAFTGIYMDTHIASDSGTGGFGQPSTQPDFRDWSTASFAIESSGYWVPPTPGQAAGVGAAALLIAALYLAWPTIKTLPALGLFSRLARPQVEGHPVRQQLLTIIEAQPGIHFAELQRRADISNGACLHHLRMMEQNRLILEKSDGGFTCYYPKTGVDRRIVQGVPAVKSPGARSILEWIVENPGASAADVARGVGLAGSTVNHHINRLRRAGLVSTRRQGKYSVLRATEFAPRVLKLT